MNDHPLATSRTHGFRWLIQTLLLANVGVAMLAGVVFVRFGSAQAAFDYAKGERLLPDAKIKSFGNVDEGRERSLSFHLANASNVPIVIMGAKPTCVCVVPDNNPIRIGAGEERELRVLIRTADRAGHVEESIRLFTNYPGQPVLDLRVVGEVREKTSGSRPDVGHSHVD